MNQLVTRAIILRRTDYNEADRILTLLTPSYGKLSLLAKGVRKIKSKLAGGIELFSVSEITFIKGRGDVGTLVASRLIMHYGRIVGDFDRTMLGYELIKRLHKATEDAPEEAYFDLLHEAFDALNTVALPSDLVRFWFDAGLLRLGGHTPNLQTDCNGNKLHPSTSYGFSLDDVAFRSDVQGRFTTDHIKFLRLVFAGNSVKVLAMIKGNERLLLDCAPIVQVLATTHRA